MIWIAIGGGLAGSVAAFIATGIYLNWRIAELNRREWDEWL